MRKERMVTRTIITVSVEVLCINMQTAQTAIKHFNLTKSQLVTDKVALAQCQVMLENETSGKEWQVVCIKAKAEEETLYGMPESDFVKYAKILPNR